MFKHDKALLREVKVENPNAQYAILTPTLPRFSNTRRTEHPITKV